jgi:hypothetical protein
LNIMAVEMDPKKPKPTVVMSKTLDAAKQAKE